MPKFIVKNTKTHDEQEFSLNQETILFGRTNTCDIELPHKIVSRRHAEITQEDENYYLSDLRSGNGTFLNHKKIRPEEKYLLGSGDVIKIEDYEIRFFLVDDQGSTPFEEVTDTDILEIKLLKKMMRALDRQGVPSVEILNGPSAGHKTHFSTEQNELTIGRGEKCDIPIPDHSLSRVHAKFENKWGGIVILDLESKNGVFVNGERTHEKLLRDGDRIILGNVKLLYRNPQEVDLQIAHQELARKKKESAIQEAEILAQEQVAERQKLEQAQAEASALQSLEADNIQETLDSPLPLEDNKTEDASSTKPEAQEASPPLDLEALKAEKNKFSLVEKIMIGLGIVVGVSAIAGLATILLK